VEAISKIKEKGSRKEKLDKIQKLAKKTRQDSREKRGQSEFFRASGNS
jgi:hypothetical protein